MTQQSLALVSIPIRGGCSAQQAGSSSNRLGMRAEGNVSFAAVTGVD